MKNQSIHETKGESLSKLTRILLIAAIIIFFGTIVAYWDILKDFILIF
jgi:hypothetical protein